MPLGRDIAPGRAEQPCQSISELSGEQLRHMIVAHHALAMTTAPTERTILITTSANMERCLQTFWNKVALIEVIISWRVGNTSI